MDGWVIVGTKLDTKQLEKDLKSAERQLSQYEKEAEKLTETKAKIEVDLRDYERQKKLIQDATDETLKLAQTEEQVNNVLDIEKMQLEELNQKYSQQFQKIEEVNQKIQENAKNQGLVKQEIQETNQKLTQAKGFAKIKEFMEDAKESTNDLLKKVAHWGLAIIGIRSVYNGIRSAISLVTSQNEEIAGQFQVMKTAIANALLPVVQQIVNWLAKILIYINQIVKAFTGKYLFDFDKAFADANKNANETEKSVKSIGKQLAGFDEMNVLSDSSNASNTSTNKNEPLVNPFENWQDIELPDWLKGVIDFIKEFDVELGILAVTIGALLGASKLGTGLLGLGSVLKGIATIGIIAVGISLFYTALTGRDLVQDLKDIYDGITKLPGANKDIQEGIKETTEEWIEYVDKAKDVALQTEGIDEATRNYATTLAVEYKKLSERNTAYRKAQKETSQLQDLFDDLTGTTKTMNTTIKENEKKMEAMVEAYGELYEAGKLTANQEKIYKLLVDDTIYSTEEKMNELQRLITVENIHRKAQEKNISYEEAYQEVTGRTSSLTKNVIDSFKEKAKQFGLNDEQISKLTETYYKFLPSLQSTKEEQNEFIEEMKKVATEAGLSEDAIFNLAKQISGLNSKTITIATKLKPETSELQSVLNTLSSAFSSAKVGTALSSLINFPKIKLAKGGIINLPGRGVPLTGAIGGEVSREGVIPLTDSQMMEELGATIGRYITINANITNTMNGRVISREMKKIQNADDFAFNG